MLRSFLLCLLLAPSALAADQFDTLRDFIRKQLVETSTPSLAVAVARDGKILWEEGFGWADREKRIGATEHTLYSLASISKPITATGLMTLVQAGKIDLDRPVNDYLGDAKLRARVGDVAQATVRRVANHTSGLPLHYQFFYVDEPYRRPSMDETILRYGNLMTVPGERYEYSNLGFGILDYVIERTAGVPYEDYMRREVFLKLGLTHTTVGIGPRSGPAWKDSQPLATARTDCRSPSTTSITAARRRSSPAPTIWYASDCFT
jgi:CubicO group peptidase (beta-lactamase class C family)